MGLDITVIERKDVRVESVVAEALAHGNKVVINADW